MWYTSVLRLHVQAASPGWADVLKYNHSPSMHACLMLRKTLFAGGAAATRRLVWSRFRLTNTLRDDGPLLTSCCFLKGFETLVAGTASGELKLHDAYKYVLSGCFCRHSHEHWQA
jgi:hypothetical protein